MNNAAMPMVEKIAPKLVPDQWRFSNQKRPMVISHAPQMKNCRNMAMVRRSFSFMQSSGVAPTHVRLRGECNGALQVPRHHPVAALVLGRLPAAVRRGAQPHQVVGLMVLPRQSGSET